MLPLGFRGNQRTGRARLALGTAGNSGAVLRSGGGRESQGRKDFVKETYVRGRERPLPYHVIPFQLTLQTPAPGPTVIQIQG